MAYRGHHEYEEINSLKKGASVSRHSFDTTGTKKSNESNKPQITGLIKKTALALGTGAMIVAAAEASDSPLFNASEAKNYFESSVVNQSDGPTFSELLAEASGHTWDDGVILRYATCTEDGLREYTCTICDDTYTESIPATGHSLETIEAIAETCTTDGATSGQRCVVCGEYIEAPQVIPMHGHDFDDGVVTKEASCTEEGLRLATCRECGEEVETSIPMTPHIPLAQPDIAATCTEDGYEGVTYCEVCGTILDEGKITPAIGHNLDAGKVTKKATCDKDGVLTYTCQNPGCKYKETEVIKATGHTEVEVAAVAATCTEPGHKAGIECSVCGKTLSGLEPTTALGHNYDGGTVTQGPTCTAEGVITHTCSRCGDTYTESIPTTSHVDGNHDYFCDACGKSMNSISSVRADHLEDVFYRIFGTVTTAYPEKYIYVSLYSSNSEVEVHDMDGLDYIGVEGNTFEVDVYRVVDWELLDELGSLPGTSATITFVLECEGKELDRTSVTVTFPAMSVQ